MPTWYEAFDQWATTCESVDSCNVGAEQKSHRRSFSRSQPRPWSNDEREMSGIERETTVILVLTHSMQDFTVLSTWIRIQEKCCTCHNYVRLI